MAKLKKAVVWIVVATLLVVPFAVMQSGTTSASEAGTASEAKAHDHAGDPAASLIGRQHDYRRYAAQYEGAERPDEAILIEAEDYVRATGMEAETTERYAGSSGTAVWTAEEGAIEWEVDVRTPGLYNIGIRYYPVEGKSSSIERELRIDGELPFMGAATLVFPRIWGNETQSVRRDNRGNDLRPRQIEKPMWVENVFGDSEGYVNEPYRFYFGKGVHRITLISTREPMAIDWLRLYQVEEPPTYEQAKAAYAAGGYEEPEGAWIKIQGEDAAWKTSPTLYGITDRASPLTEPYDVSKIRINTIGGYNWRMPGQTIAWRFQVPEDGLYRISLRVRQNLLRGVFSTRKLYVDGAVPFQELNQVQFRYSDGFQMLTLGNDDEPYLFYLTEGEHELKLEVTLGELAPLITEVESSMLELNAMYRKILMITGSVPDRFRDYRLDRQIPDMVRVFEEQSERLYAVAEQLERVTGEKSDKSAILHTLAYQLQDLAERPDTVPRRLDQFKINVGGLGTWILQTREQPLEIDYILMTSGEAELPRAEAGWLRKLGHELKAFFYSFFEDYNSIGNVSDSDESVTVWIGSGRDQAQVLKTMIDDTFTPLTGIDVNLKLVQMNVLLPATLSGQGPDVAMQIGNEVPVNFAMRNAAYDLTNFPDFAEVAGRFRESALLPYRYADGVYALPEQQVFSMLFYRKDILQELNLEVPATWEDVRTMIPVLQKHHMEFALPLLQNEQQFVTNLMPNETFAMLLYQNGGSFYKDDGKASGLDSDIAMQAFRKWTEFYTHYKFPLKFDFPNRFRIGEIPIGIADYTFYNHLAVSAPEIRGLWEFVPVPGTIGADGEIRRDVGSTGSGVIMLESARHKEASWAFMKWWTDTDTQVRFGREMEGLMGAAARYPTANVEALEQLPWPVKDYRNLEEQWRWVRGIPEVPGGYFTGRHVENAFREVVNEGTNTREALHDYVRYINDEITIKRQEFNLD